MGIGIINTNHQEKVWLRKCRWLMRTSAVGGVGTAPQSPWQVDFRTMSLVHLMNRPKIAFDRQEINHVQEKVTYHNRPTWEPIDIVLLNTASDDAAYRWLQQHYDPNSEQWGYRAEAVTNIILMLVNGLGKVVEQWTIQEAWASSIDWGELDYSSTEIATTTITVEYQRAINDFVIDNTDDASGFSQSGQIANLPI